LLEGESDYNAAGNFLNARSESIVSGPPVHDAEEENLADLLFGLIALRESFLNRNQLDLAVASQEAYYRKGRRLSLGEVCRLDGYISPPAVRRVLELQDRELRSDRDALFGALSVRNGFVTARDVDRAVAVQSSEGGTRQIGRILLEAGRITSQQHRAVLTAQRRLLRSRYRAPGALDPESSDPIRWLGAYLILREISRTGMGVVYRAYDPAADVEVALKTLPGGAAPAQVERIRSEARAVSGLDHANIVRLRDVGTSEGIHYFTLDFIEGRTLDDRIREGGLPLPAVCRILATVCDALHYAHGRGIVHRDVKPSNILLDREGVPFVTDFGLAVQAGPGDGTAAGPAQGTPEYMSPEQAGGAAPVDARTDVYGVGAVLYRILCGRPPFTGQTAELLRRIAEEEPRPPGELEPGLPGDLVGICLRCLRKDPAERYPTAGALAAELRQWADGSQEAGS
jgi:hypothetical protein